MFDTELINVVLHNQRIADIKLNFIYKMLIGSNTKDKIPVNRSEIMPINHKKTVVVDHINFSQIPIRNTDEFLSLESELKEHPESVVSFETLLENLGSPENYSEFIKQITSKLFTPNFMEQLGWSQIGAAGLQLKDTTMKESIYNVFAKKYDGIQEDILNEKFSQHFRSFRLNRNKVSLSFFYINFFFYSFFYSQNRSKQKLKTEQSESSS